MLFDGCAILSSYYFLPNLTTITEMFPFIYWKASASFTYKYMLFIVSFFLFSAKIPYRRATFVCLPPERDRIHVGIPAVSRAASVENSWWIWFTSSRKAASTAADTMQRRSNRDVRLATKWVAIVNCRELLDCSLEAWCDDSLNEVW